MSNYDYEYPCELYENENHQNCLKHSFQLLDAHAQKMLQQNINRLNQAINEINKKQKHKLHHQFFIIILFSILFTSLNVLLAIQIAPKEKNYQIGDRVAYLRDQLRAEKQADKIVYITPLPTNALAPSDFIEKILSKDLDRYKENISQSLELFQPEFEDLFKQWKSQVISVMKERSKHLEYLILKGDCNIEVFFWEDELNKKLNTHRSRIAYIIALLEKTSMRGTIKIRVIPKIMSSKTIKDSFAIIFPKNHEQTPIVACASQTNASQIKSESTLTNEKSTIESKIERYTLCQKNALSHEETIVYLKWLIYNIWEYKYLKAC